MRIDIKSIPHEKHRYETVGDYFFLPENAMWIRVSKMGKVDYEFLVALHELVEAWLVKRRGISEESITAFDIAFEGEGEPGDDPAAPYYKEHQFATAIERLMCNELGIPWHEYDKAVEEL